MTEGEARFLAEHALGVAGELEAECAVLRRQLFEQRQRLANCVGEWGFERDGLVWEKEQAEARAAIAEEELRAVLEELDAIRGRSER